MAFIALGLLGPALGLLLPTNDSLVGNGRRKVGPSRPRAMKPNELRGGKGTPKVCPRRPKEMTPDDVLGFIAPVLLGPIVGLHLPTS